MLKKQSYRDTGFGVERTEEEMLKKQSYRDTDFGGKQEMVLNKCYNFVIQNQQYFFEINAKGDEPRKFRQSDEIFFISNYPGYSNQIPNAVVYTSLIKDVLPTSLCELDIDDCRLLKEWWNFLTWHPGNFKRLIGDCSQPIQPPSTRTTPNSSCWP
ncbi:hypothetical protein CMV_024909 [Castanea mollissima]|uniref:Uncharacterized protein n=1 Tax=Castanea mollissima TaxID=60419 RepID=A0A8J4QLS7_9ROSI|nr:hypothetical protein CMV_024909 [Castanea mollissima]